MELVKINDLSLSFLTGGIENNVLHSVDVEINQGEIVGIVGESGSGKSTLAHAIMQLLPENITKYKSGKIIFGGKNIMQMDKKELMQVRGNDIGMIFQEPMSSLNPLHTIYKQIEEVLLLHGMKPKDVKSRVIELLELVGLDKLTDRLKTYPHELSGGQRQRVMIAMALANNPKLLIADEPTTALDVNIQSQILDLLKDLNKKIGMSILLISHDLHMVKLISDKIYVMHQGEIIENGATQDIFDNPREKYTKYLLHCRPKDILVPYNQSANITLDVENMNVKFPLQSAILKRNRKYLHAVNDISIELRQGQTLGIVGESGSGKTTLVNAILRLIKSEGKISINGNNITNMKAKELRSLRQNIQIVFQDPFSSLNPRMSVEQIIAEGLKAHNICDNKEEEQQKVAAILDKVGLGGNFTNRFPHELSGGQRQRVAIARAIILNPKVVILDEPTSALDKTVQAQVLELLMWLQKENDLSYIFISHDLQVITSMSHDVAVMRNGKIVEYGKMQNIKDNPNEEYTKQLLAHAYLD